MKAISICMGHFDENFTKKVYVKLKQPVYGTVKETEDFFKSVEPKNDGTLSPILQKSTLEFLLGDAYNKDIAKVSTFKKI